MRNVTTQEYQKKNMELINGNFDPLSSCLWGTSSISYLELTAELFLDADFSLAVLKLLALLSSLLKLLALFRAGLALWGWRRGESRGMGEWVGRGDGERDGDLIFRS